MKFSEFENYYTTSPAEYKKSIYNDLGNDDERYLDLIKDIDDFFKQKKEDSLIGYQRIVDEERVEEIKNYIESNEFGIIPNSIIVSVNAIEAEDEDRKNEILNNSDENKALLYKDQLFIPYEQKIFLIIDGQHRIEGCKRLSSEYKDKMELIITFIINADMKTQAQLFTTINYKVKPVNKSYLYQILGEFNIGDAEILFLHEFIKLLNELEHSPLQDRVKMLGKQNHEKNSMSQAFLAESLITLISPKYKIIKPLLSESEVIKLPVFRYHFLNKQTRMIIAKFIIIYFKTIKKIYNDLGFNWEDKQNNIFLKTIGMGALIDLLPNIYILFIGKNQLIEKQDSIDFNIISEQLIFLLKPLTSIDLIKEITVEFSKGSGRGPIKKLTNKMWQLLLLENPEFINYQNEYINWFNATIILNVERAGGTF